MPPKKPKQPAPVIVRPSRPQPEEVFAAWVRDGVAPQPRRRLFSGFPNTTPRLRRHICPKITHAKSWYTLQRKVIWRYGLLLDGFTAVVFFRHAPRLRPAAASLAGPAPRPPPSGARLADPAAQRSAYDQLIAATCAALESKLPSFSTRTLLTLLEGLVACRPPQPPLRYLAAWTSAMGERLPLLPPRALAATAIALGRLRYRPPETFLRDHFYAAVMDKVPSMSSCQLCGVLSMLSRCQLQPPAALPAALSAALMEREQSQRDVLAGPPVEALAALSHVGYHPGATWMEWFYARVGEALSAQAATPEDVSAAAVALAGLQAQPPQHFLQALLAAAVSRAPLMAPRHLAPALWALARLAPDTPPSVQAALVEAARQQLPSSCPSDMLHMLVAFEVWGLRPPPREWLSSFQLASRRLLPAMTWREICAVAAMLARLRVRGVGAWAAEAAAAASAATARLEGEDGAAPASLEATAGNASASAGAEEGGVLARRQHARLQQLLQELGQGEELPARTLKSAAVAAASS